MRRRKVVLEVIVTRLLVITIAIGARFMKTNISNHHNKGLHLPKKFLIPIRHRAEEKKLSIINNNSNRLTKVDFFSKDKKRTYVRRASPSSKLSRINVTYIIIVKAVPPMAPMAVFSAEYQHL